MGILEISIILLCGISMVSVLSTSLVDNNHEASCRRMKKTIAVPDDFGAVKCDLSQEDESFFGPEVTGFWIFCLAIFWIIPFTIFLRNFRKREFAKWQENWNGAAKTPEALQWRLERALERLREVVEEHCPQAGVDMIEVEAGLRFDFDEFCRRRLQILSECEAAERLMKQKETAGLPSKPEQAQIQQLRQELFDRYNQLDATIRQVHQVAFDIAAAGNAAPQLTADQLEASTADAEEAASVAALRAFHRRVAEARQETQ